MCAPIFWAVSTGIHFLEEAVKSAIEIFKNNREKDHLNWERGKLTMDRNQLLENIEDYLSEASPEEVDVLSSILEGLKGKKHGEYRSYISALTMDRRRFLDNGDYEVRLPIQPLIYNPLNFVHGGITATLLDTAMGSFVNQSLPEHLAAVTTEMKVNYLKPGTGKELICIASIIHKGTSFYVCEAKVYNDKNKLIASGSGSFFIIKRK